MAVEVRSQSAFATAQRRFDAAADVIGLSEDQRRLLREIKRELVVHFPVKLDDGRVRVFTGYRVHHACLTEAPRAAWTSTRARSRRTSSST